MLQSAAHPLAFLAGLALVLATILSAVRTFVLPRSANVLLSRLVFRATRKLFDLRASTARGYAERDALMALYAPISLLCLPVAWLTLALFGYAAMYWAIGVDDFYQAVVYSGSGLLTLGTAHFEGWVATALLLSEAGVGLGLLSLLIAYLPTMYAAFSRREAMVNMLEVRAGSPPTAGDLILRFHRLHSFEKLTDLWTAWEQWFVDVEETHTSLAALSFFRSPQPEHSWVTAAGAVLDGAAVVLAVVDVPHDVQADLTLCSGYLALREIARYFRIPFEADPKPDDPISIARWEFDALCDQLAEAGVPLKPDRDQAWRDFAGWRVNYDVVLLELARLTMAPYAPWSSDRSLSRRARRALA